MRLFSLLLTLLITLTFAPSSQAAELPATSLKKPTLVPEQSVSTFIPSDSAPGQGLAVNVIYPKKPRYTDGAPVVVVAPGGEGASGLEFSTHAAQSGFAEVRFAFPGGGKQGFASSGIYDYRGMLSQQALRDVLLFAGGKLKDTQGRTISKLVPMVLSNKNVGLIGWSNGGNIAVITLAKYAQQLPFVNYLTFYESPLGSMFYPPMLGGSQDLLTNPHYRQGSAATGNCLVDYRKLCFQADGQKKPGSHKKLGQPEVPGIVFFDENGNKQWDEELEFAFPYCCDIGLEKQIYPPHVTVALGRSGLFTKWPKTIASLAESEAYFNERDGSLFLQELAKEMPNLFICVVGTRLDHLQRQPDHPHIPLNYNSWLANKIKFVRLNPDPIYIGTAAGMNSRNFSDNKPGASVDADDVDALLEPEGLVPDYLFIDAAVAELADRKRTGNLKPELTEPIVSYSLSTDTAGGASAVGNGTKTASSGKSVTGAHKTK
jgi:hypothetical protein